ncbi:MAG: hypothetical protein LBN18_05550 [Dysgonamonadaceae bacterium]|jgi:hypothetical protein|nr:hypothetical protein [Dysgonamonadaceae bacterium]
MRKIVFGILFWMFSCVLAHAQDELTPGYVTEGGERIETTKKGDRFFAAGVGAGVSYGNLGVKVQAKLTKGFGLSAAIGTRSFPLSIPVFIRGDDEVEDFFKESGLPFTNKSLKGLSLNAGFDFWAGNDLCIGLHYVQFGRYLSLYDNQQKPVHGFTMLIDGHIPLGDLPLALTVGGNFGAAFGSDKFMEMIAPADSSIDYGFFGAFVFGIDLGICYKFKY